MAATKTTRKPKTATKAPKAAKQKQAEPEATPEEKRREAISAAMKELADVRTAARAKRNGTPAKHLIFDEWFKALLAGKAFDLDAIAKKFPEVKPTTIRAWVSKWRHNQGVGRGYPSNARGKEKEIKAALKKAGAAA
jgi:hypothetical protein